MRTRIRQILQRILSVFAPKSRTDRTVTLVGKVISIEDSPVDTDYKEAKAE